MTTTETLSHTKSPENSVRADFD